MSEPELKPEDVPLLFPDPVIEYYLAKIDRAAIREQLKKTPGQRLEWLQKKMEAERKAEAAVVREEPVAWRPKKNKIDMGVDPAWFANAKAVPLLFPDPVTEVYLEDVDRGSLRENCKLSVEERLDQFASFMKSVYALRGAALPDKSGLWEEYPLDCA